MWGHCQLRDSTSPVNVPIIALVAMRWPERLPCDLTLMRSMVAPAQQHHEREEMMGEPPFYSDKDDGDDDHAANDDDVDVNDDDGGDNDDDRSTRIREEPPFYFVLVSCPSSSPAALPACASSKSPTTTSSSSQETANWCVCYYLLLLATTCFFPSLATIWYHILPLELVMRLFFISTYAFRFMHIDKNWESICAYISPYLHETAWKSCGFEKKAHICGYIRNT